MSGTRLSDLEYTLDAACIARHPVSPRDSARMMVLHRKEDRVEHRFVRDLAEYLTPMDTLVLNRTRVVPARIDGLRFGDSRVADGLFIRACARRGDREVWLAALRYSKRFRVGDFIQLGVDRLELLARDGEYWEVGFAAGEPALVVLNRSGRTPIPPYIRQARCDDDGVETTDRCDYQTVFAVESDLASIAAPTAGLHFTPQLLQCIAQKGVARVEVELEVGPGTFKPVECAVIADHPMHTERFVIPPEAAEVLSRLPARSAAEAGGAGKAGRLVAVGTTTVRLLESMPRPLPPATAGTRSQTSILIEPGFQFQWTDALMTNFHLPRSTLLALVGAFAGLDRVKNLYGLAQREGYRFFSFGDAMLILE